MSGECKISFVGVYAWSCKKDGGGVLEEAGDWEFCFLGRGAFYLSLSWVASGMLFSFGRVNGRAGGR